MAEQIWASRFKGTNYRLSTTDLTVGRLRLMKAKYGADYGAYATFIRLLALGDIDALVCAVWIAQTVAGEKPRDPNEMDFNLDDFEAIEEEEPEPAGKEPDPTPEAEAESHTPTSDSPPTLTGSEPSTSSD